MKTFLLQASLLLALGACGGGGSEGEGEGGAGTARELQARRAADEGRVSVYHSLESVQCEGGGRTLAELKDQLLAARVVPLDEACGHDGLMRAAVCGAPDGRIGIFEVPQGQAERAIDAGFGLLEESLPGASRTPAATC